MSSIKNLIRCLLKLPIKFMLILMDMYSRTLTKIDPNGTENYLEEKMQNIIDKKIGSNLNFKNEIRYKSKLYNYNNPLKFFTPNRFSSFRAHSLFFKEKDTLEWIERHGGDGKILYDIGSNIGVYSLYYKSLFNSKVYAFEPSYKNLDILKKNIEINNMSKSIFIIPNPIHNSTSVCKFVQGRDEYASASAGIDNQKNKNYFQTISLNLDYLTENRIIDYPDLIKIDVDGNEMEILNGSKNSISHCKTILVEVRKETKDKIYKFLTEKNFIIEESKTSNIIWIKNEKKN